jgi:putative ABC transport system permease protein
MAGLYIDLKIALLNLLEHRRRSAILGTAIAVVACLSVLLSALVTGARNSTLEVATTVATGELNVGGYYKVTTGQPAAVVSDYQPVEQVVRRALPELDSMVDRGRGWGRLISDEGVAIVAGIAGIDVSAEPRLRSVLAIRSGRLQDLAQPNSVVMFEEQARKLGVKVGDTVTVLASLRNGATNTVDCKVVGVAAELGALSRFIVFISLSTWRHLYRVRDNVTGALHLRVQPQFADNLPSLAARLRKELTGAGYQVMESDGQASFNKLERLSREEFRGQVLDVTTWEEELPFQKWSIGWLRGVGLLLLFALSFITLAGVMNTLAIAVRERTREIGTLRAIGLQRTGVARLFLLEAALLGALGASAGVALALVMIYITNASAIAVPLVIQLFVMKTTLELALEPSAGLAVIALITVATTLAALLPTLRAARRSPVDAIAYIG